MIVYGSTLSPFVRKTMAFAAETGIAVESRPVALGSADPGFLEASPFRKMPAFRDGDFTLADSTAIITNFEVIRREPALTDRLAGGSGASEVFANLRPSVPS